MLKAKLLSDTAILPTCEYPGEDLAFDMYASEDAVLIQNVPVMIKTGVAAQFHDSYGVSKYGLVVKDRSSMAKKGIFTTGGVIDAGYTGEITIFLTDQFSRGLPYEVKAGDKIAQLIPQKVRTEGGVLKVTELEESKRGEKGFGSSGHRYVGVFG
jgi:dUTP pyrophosphatase